jgi:hypothetical protein
MYYIYHIPGVKIGCSQNIIKRINHQKFKHYEILEEHDDVFIASERELQLQKQYGYKVDVIPYYESLRRITLAQKKSAETKDEWLPKVDWEARDSKVDWEARKNKIINHPNFIKAKNDPNRHQKTKEGLKKYIRPVYQYDVEGNYIQEFIVSARDMDTPYKHAKGEAKRRENGLSQGHYKGFLYSYEKKNKIEPYKHRVTNSKAVCNLDSFGNIIKIYKNITEAALEMKCSVSAISLVVRGINPYAKGYKWVFLKNVKKN